ncbi:MAG: protein kinase domain-containing protein [Bryobacteraceae bacterium]
MPLSPGTKLGPYEITAPLGAGGMGEVYKARDTRLDRLVAIKTSKTEFSERFAREARAVAALNHPNICQLYDLGTLPEGGSYLVMEFIDGSPIAPVDSPRRLLDLAVQIADGMAAAHAAGFTHRDLKPDNILITGPQTPLPGRVKILDFGLAKHAASIPQTEATQTIAAVTNPGTVMGTVAYMSPEQARGEEVDSRSDQFSFGLIVYELAARKRAFARPSAAETMAAIIRDEAEPLPPAVPAPLRWVVERCLAKDPAERYDSTRDLYRELKHAREHLSESSASGQQAAQPAMPRPRWHGIVTFAVLATACAAGAFFFLRSTHSDSPSFQSLTFRREIISNARFAPDGKTVVYDSTEDGVKYHIYSAQPGNPERRDLGIDAKLLDVSSTGQMALRNASGELQSAPVAGGAPRTVAEGVSSAAWSPDGKELAIVRTIDGHNRLEYPAGKVLYQSPGSIYNLRISRDGQVVYLADYPLRGDAAGFVRMIDTAGKATTLSPHCDSLLGLSNPKDGDGVLYSASTEGSEVALYLASRTGHVRRIAGFPEWYVLHAVNAVGEMLLKRCSLRGLMFVSESPSSPSRDLSWHDYSSPADLSTDGKSVLFLEGGFASRTDYEIYLTCDRTVGYYEVSMVFRSGLRTWIARGDTALRAPTRKPGGGTR